MSDYHRPPNCRGGPPALSPPIGYLPFDTQHVLLNTVQQMLEESCFEFAKKWFPYDNRVKMWTTPAQVEISKWRDILSIAHIPAEALDTTAYTPLRLLLQEATFLRNNAVHRSPVDVEHLLRLLTSAVQLTRMLRDQTRQMRIQKLIDHLKDELVTRVKNRADARKEYNDTIEDITRRRKPIIKKFNKLDEEKDMAATKFEQDAALHDTLLQSRMTRFINEVIHTGEAINHVSFILPGSGKGASVGNHRPIFGNSQASLAAENISESSINTRRVTNAPTEGRGDDVQFISKRDFEEATSENRQLWTKAARDTNVVVPRASSVVKDHSDIKARSDDSPSKQLVCIPQYIMQLQHLRSNLLHYNISNGM
jgi:hypothetical protein